MKRCSATVKAISALLAACLLPFFPASTLAAGASLLTEPPRGRLLSPDNATVVVQRELYACQPEATAPEIQLFVLGTESEVGGQKQFHPLAALAFDRTLGTEPGQWLAYWVFGPGPANGWRHLQAFFPIPAGAPKVSEKELIKLEEDLGALQRNPERAKKRVPGPVVTLASLGRSSMGDGFWGGLQRGLSWANVLNPAQFVYRSYLHRRNDREERKFQRAYAGLQWLNDLEFNSERDARWVATLNDLRFHALRNRSFFGRFLTHAEGMELVHNFESDVRVQLGKSSSWLQGAANEHHLRYQPIYRFTANGARFPIGGVLYYDPSLGTVPDPGWWRVSNPFDLSYNPHTHPEVQRLARENPGELIPLAIYTFQTALALRPIVVVDFFDPGNPRRRESSYELMVLTRQWLAITTSFLGYERIPYEVVSWAANKKGFTYFVNRSSRLGIEELRMALEADLYFDPAVRDALLDRADQRVLNPLVRPGRVEEQLARIQFESLRAEDGRALCRQVNEVRQTVRERLAVPAGEPAAQREEFARKLEAWRHQVRLQDYLESQPEELGSLAALREPLEYFLTNEPVKGPELEKLLAKLYATLYRQQLSLPAEHAVTELESALELTREVWQRRFASEPAFEKRRARAEQQTRARVEDDRRRMEERRLKGLRSFLEATHKELRQAARLDCSPETPLPPELEAHLSLLAEIGPLAATDPALRGEWQRHAGKLESELARLEGRLSACARSTDPQRAEIEDSCLELTRLLLEQLTHPPVAQAAGGH
ncbi:MAG TPA: hypothetical protein VNN18_13280 [Candidatus Xenobia bacterium]|nr:hypothetical protein [Candidatus Xenobia bacterium]